MEELKVLVDMVAHLPAMALWVLVGFFAYKVIIVGSIYGVIKFVVEKIHNVLVTRKTEVKTVELHATIDAMTISTDGSYSALVAQLERLKPMSYSYEARERRIVATSSYIHKAAVDWLREAIDEKIEKEHLLYKNKQSD